MKYNPNRILCQGSGKGHPQKRFIETKITLFEGGNSTKPSTKKKPSLGKKLPKPQ
jgi:hypothetical protein